jgi:hypothetical protein
MAMENSLPNKLLKSLAGRAESEDEHVYGSLKRSSTEIPSWRTILKNNAGPIPLPL